MSIEEEIRELKAAIKENTEELRFLTSAARDGATRSTGRSTSKDTDEAEKPTRARASSRSTKEKVPSVKEISEATKAFLDVDDATEYEDRKDIIKRIVKKFKAAKMSEIDEKYRIDAMRLLEIAKAGDDPFEDERSGDGDDDFV